jgi:hypothetical protein
MNVLKLFTLALLLPACEQDADASGGDAGLAACLPSPLYSLGGRNTVIRRDGAPERGQAQVDFDGTLTFRGIQNGLAQWDDGSQLPPPLQMSAGLLQEGTAYRVRHTQVGAEEQWWSTTITAEGRLVLFSVSGTLERATERLRLVGLEAAWIPRCTYDGEASCYTPNTHFHLRLTTPAGELGDFSLGDVARWVSELGTFEVLLEGAVEGLGPGTPCADIPHSAVWLTMRAVP